MYFIKIFSLIFLVSCGNIWWGNFSVIDVKLADTLEITFSSSPAPQTLKKALSVHGDGEKIEGTLNLEGKKAIFRPGIQFSQLTEYTLNISTLAENEKGISLEKNYHKIFNEKKHRPFKIIDFSPKNEEIMGETHFPIKIVFSDGVDEKSLMNAFSLSPDADVIFNFSEDKTVVTVLPTEEFSRENTYMVKISDTVTSSDNRKLDEQYTSSFAFTDDYSSPNFTVFAAWDDEIHEFSETAELVGFPNDGSIRIEFSKEMNTDEISPYIQIRPEIGRNIITDERNKKIAKIEFTEKLSWNETYTLTLKKGIPDLWGNITSEEKQFSFVADNEQNRPPEFWGVAFDCGENPADEPVFFSATNQFPDIFFNINRFPSAETSEAGVSAKIFLFFSTSRVSNISLKSAMDNIDIQVTNSCMNFSLRKIRISEELPLDREIFREVQGKIGVVEFTSETKNFNRNGLIKLKIHEKFSDEVGNSMAGDVDFILNKKNEI